MTVVADYKYIEIQDITMRHSRKTRDYMVIQKSSGALLGYIKFYSNWRQHCLAPEVLTIWSKGCLADVISFITEETDRRRSAAHKLRKEKSNGKKEIE